MLLLVNLNQNQTLPTYVNFIIGGLSGAMGQTVTHPLDVTKVRMQISKASLVDVVKASLQEVGVSGFYIGWTAGLLRQLTYTTTRLGIYTTLYNWAQSQFDHLNYPAMIGIGMISGVMGSFIGTPTDLVLVRMIADIKLPPEQRWNYRNAITGLIDISKAEGIAGLWRGAVPTMTRAAIVNGMQLGTYSRAKLMFKDTGFFEEGILLSFLAAMASGFVMSVTSLPVDVAKTRIQNWTSPTKPPGVIGMISNIAQTEGLPALWRGFLPYFSRAAPNAVVTMICLDQLTQLYIKVFMSAE
ncbi:Mitochondrial 2-oxoglutarate/malate carrier protein [Habropoda laboriosa]|uniref:Mitochondrial 2-oxoglutarate/malate carrier protein n=1 Tax=Habropoda laboriosa TaxID=597456 RepID=A0A0L7QQZ4_9HYME|nr:Mitochondrial 2-oxoglutarate/malate carrier protein [Habropoda laboriosa]